MKNSADQLADLEIGDDLTITKKKRQVSAGGTWVSGTLNGHRFEALVFSEHALSESYELDDSRISKLRILEIASKKEVAYFDRGWDLQPQTPLAHRIVDFLAAGLADYVYAP